MSNNCQPEEPGSVKRKWWASRDFWIGVIGFLFTIAVAWAVIYYWDRVQELQQYGYIGVFLISIFGGATILAPVPMTPLVFAMGGVLNPFIVGTAAGIGETIGGIVIYMTGYGGGTPLINREEGKIKDAYLRVMDWMSRRGTPTLFLLSATVNPFFYPCGLTAGALRYGLRKFIIVSLFGKIIKGMTVALAGYWGLRGILRWLGMPV